mmetsp:Transcript_4256/g.12817  ORF Transcript_4256/g.12817 Transcript_4256/m.12817 type:complete len:292 (-) Transcript_4256:2018-2893(-)
MDETPEEVQARHKLETKEMNKRAERLISSVSKKDKAGRQRINEEISMLRQELRQKQADELKELGIESKVESDSLGTNKAEDVVLSVATGGPVYKEKKLSKQQQRRKQKQQAEREKEFQRALQRASAGPTERDSELKALREVLSSQMLGIHEIIPDGDCLFSAVAHQLKLLKVADESADSLRRKTADNLLENMSTYIYFIEDVNGDEQKYQEYCQKMRDTHAWGGEVEIRVMATIFKVRIVVYAVGLPLTTHGEENTSPTLRLSFHRKYFGLGEHYNSVIMSTEQAKKSHHA